MPTEKLQIRELLHAYIQNELSPKQTEELFSYLNSHPELSETLLKELAETFEDKMAEAEPLNHNISQRMLDGLLSQINTAPVVELPQTNNRKWKRWIAAAAVILMFASSWYFMTANTPETIAPKIVVNPQHIKQDVLPGYDGAILTTAEGEQIILDSTSNGIVQREANTNVIKQDNQLVYKGVPDVVANSESFNTLSTLKGRKFQLVLADGTKVWLDAASSITYPIAFNGKQRKVKASGQVYFEVAKDASKPFIVEVGETSVQVLGTHFNINAYNDEAAMKTTLLEGSIKITNNNSSSLLTPGQQAAISKTSRGTIKVNNEVDLDAVMAWRNGIFQFDRADLGTVLRQLSRWYDVEVVYEGSIPKREFEGKIGRDLNLSQVVKLLEKLQLHFQIEGNKLIVQP